jgi:uncharacterized protein (TIGR02646 family)
MIHRDRYSIAIPDSCNGQGSESEIELQEATDFYSSYQAEDKSFNFKVYKNDDIKNALEGLFKKKCAYCESYYLHIHPTDLEHYRPKGRVKKENNKGFISPGYWWLAADWNNLLPSCIDCNRKRTHKMKYRQVLLGKADHFPIHPDSNNLRLPGSEASETPLLINPCTEDPLDHLTFFPVSEKPIAIPLNASGISKLKANASIKYYGLNRPKLIEERANRYKELGRCFMRIEKFLKRQKEQKIDFTQEINDELEVINEDYLDDSKPYTISCRKMFNLWIRTLESNS